MPKSFHYANAFLFSQSDWSRTRGARAGLVDSLAFCAANQAKVVYGLKKIIKSDCVFWQLFGLFERSSGWHSLDVAEWRAKDLLLIRGR